MVTSVYGLSEMGSNSNAYLKMSAEEKADVPPELLNLYKSLIELDDPHSKKWVPRYVEVVLWDYSYAAQPSITWPHDWPSLDSARAVKRSESYSIFIDGSLAPQLVAFLATRREKGTVKISGRKMAADFRYTYPGEPTWRKAFSDLQASLPK